MEILAAVTAAESDLAAHDDTPSGRVIISAFPTAAVALAPGVADQLRPYPNLTLVMRQAPPSRNLDRLRAGETDIALVDDWTGEWTRYSPALTFTKLCLDPTVLILPPNHPLATQEHPTVADLVDQRWITAPPTNPPAKPSTRC
jgi:DNA-binding transcriptional LysR family regulator